MPHHFKLEKFGKTFETASKMFSIDHFWLNYFFRFLDFWNKEKNIVS